MNREDGSARNFRDRARRTFDTASSFYGIFDFFSRGVFVQAAGLLDEAVPLSAGTPVLEVFCATGLFSRILASRGAAVTAIDISPLMIRRASHEAHGLGVRFLVADAADLPFGNDSFGLVVAGRGLHAMPGAVRDEVVAEIHRVCAGRALFMEPKRSPHPLDRIVMGLFERLEGGYADYLKFIGLDFKAYLSEHGFAVRDLMERRGESILLGVKVRSRGAHTNLTQRSHAFP